MHKEDSRRAGTCPGCGAPAECGMAKGQATCWCVAFPHALQVPAQEAEARCYCRPCLERLIGERMAAREAGLE
ncbi:MAG: cysteine-rich CWC family protein [Hyphomicrobiaceae bacterium]|nr:MAG: cysteine-rich CWC family protein [Hyphomicrobiaceae bacterium]